MDLVVYSLFSSESILGAHYLATHLKGECKVCPENMLGKVPKGTVVYSVGTERKDCCFYFPTSKEVWKEYYGDEACPMTMDERTAYILQSYCPVPGSKFLIELITSSEEKIKELYSNALLTEAARLIKQGHWVSKWKGKEVKMWNVLPTHTPQSGNIFYIHNAGKFVVFYPDGKIEKHTKLPFVRK